MVSILKADLIRKNKKIFPFPSHPSKSVKILLIFNCSYKSKENLGRCDLFKNLIIDLSLFGLALVKK